MISCRGASWLSSQSLDRPLTKLESVLLKAHLLFCDGCRRYDRQLKWLRRHANDLGHFLDDESATLPPLPESARQRIAEAIHKESN